jgi:thiamine-monophosphate kinase
VDELTIIAAAANLPRVGGGVVLGIGDDGAVVTPAQGYEVLVTDTLAEGTHFKRGWTSPEDLGWKTLAVNVSDLAAMGASPRHGLLTLALPVGIDDSWVHAFMLGLGEASHHWRLPIVGGDTVRAPAIVITVAATGQTAHPLRRAGAEPDWLLAVTGTIGGAAAGLSALAHGRSSPAEAIRRWRRPPARLEAGLALAASGLPVAVTDCSDGLVVSCDLLAGALGYELTVASLPIDPAARAATTDPQQAETWALFGGEDYELVLAFPAEKEEAVRQAVAPLPLTVVGRLLPSAGGWLVRGQWRGPLDAGGSFRHF